jgi:hypothetical protein
MSALSFNSSHAVPSLADLSKLSVVCLFLEASKSTAGMQSLLEKKEIQDSGLSLPFAIIAIVLCSISRKSSIPLSLKDCLVKYFLEKTGLYKDSDVLTQIIPSPKGANVYFALYEVTRRIKTLLGPRLNLSWDYNFWYKTTLFSATQIALLTGCEAFAAGFITDGPRSVFVLRSLAKFYTHFFVNGYTHRFKLITNTILDIFLSVSIAPFGGDKNALLHCLPWVAVAFLQHSCATAEESGAAIAKLAVLISGGYNNYAIESLRVISRIDVRDQSDDLGYHDMALFAQSSRRKKITYAERRMIVLGFIRELFRADILNSSFVAECMRIYCIVDRKFYAPSHAIEIDGILSEPTGILCTLSAKQSLFVTCTLMNYMRRCIRNGQMWCNHYSIIIFGLSWLRTALSSREGIINFDNSGLGSLCLKTSVMFRCVSVSTVGSITAMAGAMH